MQLKNCSRCSKLFVATSNSVCPQCIDKEEQDFHRVHDYIFENLDADIVEVSKATGVSENKIVGYLRDGRLIDDKLKAMIPCVTCGTLIKTGNLCGLCAGKLAREISSKVRI